ncbi:hypothetical protein BKA70DRAFT_202180 [Coprinopsis sp. MPI-PUGE-AT-0042]|nr:hypothetical protein BKA70DRAFT_202180 [Coprinopsis sp. MPI-PUGE-AT-0042]
MMSAPIETDIKTLATTEAPHEPNLSPNRRSSASSPAGTQSFAGDPLTPIFSGNDSEIDILLLKAALGSAAVGGALHVLVIPTSANGANEETSPQERIIGVAAWFPPGMSSNATPEQRAAGWETYMETVEKKNPKLKAWWIDYFIPHSRKVTASILPEDFIKNSWHLQLFGVEPTYHSQGLGKKLFKFAEDQAKSTSSPIFLGTATDLNILIYRKLGLDRVGETKIESEYGTAKMTFLVKKWE